MSLSPIDEPLASELADKCGRLQTALDLAVRDRELLGYDIHDGMVQDLAAAALLLESAGNEVTFASGETRKRFDGGLRLLRGAIDEARRLIGRSVGSVTASSDLPAELARLVERFRQRHGLPAAFECEFEPPPLSSDVQGQLLRIAQEALFNVLKHAQASEAWVRLSQDGDKLRLSVADNGQGFEPGALPAGHFGLAGMRARCRLIGAEVLFDTAPRHGTRIVVDLPLAGKPGAC